MDEWDWHHFICSHNTDTKITFKMEFQNTITNLHDSQMLLFHFLLIPRPFIYTQYKFINVMACAGKNGLFPDLRNIMNETNHSTGKILFCSERKWERASEKKTAFMLIDIWLKRTRVARRFPFWIKKTSDWMWSIWKTQQSNNNNNALSARDSKLWDETRDANKRICFSLVSTQQLNVIAVCSIVWANVISVHKP